MALGAAVLVGRTAVAIVGLSLVISFAYSARPLRCSYRTYLAPLVLAVAYVLVPYWLGLVAARAGFGPNDRLLAGALLALFLARINLKDFRDREGDARYGKPTLLLGFGKRVTCLASLATLPLGNVLLLVALRPPLRLVLVAAGRCHPVVPAPCRLGKQRTPPRQSGKPDGIVAPRTQRGALM